MCNTFILKLIPNRIFKLKSMSITKEKKIQFHRGMTNLLIFPPNSIGQNGRVNESNPKLNWDEFIQGHEIGQYLNHIKHCSIWHPIPPGWHFLLGKTTLCRQGCHPLEKPSPHSRPQPNPPQHLHVYLFWLCRIIYWFKLNCRLLCWCLKCPMVLVY